MHEWTLNRRLLFQSLIALSAVGGLAACGQGSEAPDAPVSNPPPAGYFTAEEMAFISALAKNIIPETETAGAIQAGVPKTLQDLATDWGDDAFRAYWRSSLMALDLALSETGDKPFATLSEEAQQAALAAYDASVFAGEVEDGFYREFKASVVQAYYMSEPGATEELAYEPVPGEWIGCVPLSDYPKTWAT